MSPAQLFSSCVVQLHLLTSKVTPHGEIPSGSNGQLASVRAICSLGPLQASRDTERKRWALVSFSDRWLSQLTRRGRGGWVGQICGHCQVVGLSSTWQVAQESLLGPACTSSWLRGPGTIYCWRRICPNHLRIERLHTNDQISPVAAWFPIAPSELMLDLPIERGALR